METKSYKTKPYTLRAVKAYYDRIKDTEEYKMKNRQRYIEKKKKKYIEENGSEEGFAPPKSYKL